MNTCCIIGLGYIGLPTAAILAASGQKVHGVDIDIDIVNTINKGKVHIVEPFLEKLIKKSVLNGNFKAHLKPCHADTFVITVPTPIKETALSNIPQPNIEYVFSAAKSIAPFLKPGNLLIIESTCPVGTTEEVAQIIFDINGLDSNQIDIAYCPERVIPGHILDELVSNDRVIGGLTIKASNEGKKFYSNFCKGNLSTTNARTAELVKLTENSFRDVNLAFSNELSRVSHQLNVDVRELIRLANYHPRVNILQPGCGVGGHCIAVDPWFIASQVPKETPLIQTARKVNDHKTDWVIDQINIYISNIKKKIKKMPVIAILGLAFKPNVDDLRESPALRIANKILLAGHKIMVCEPNLSDHSVFQLSTIEETVDNADILIFLVGHKEFKSLNLSNKNYIDFCGITRIY